jgi:thiamine biosynthesis lipoprotein ApbE
MSVGVPGRPLQEACAPAGTSAAAASAAEREETLRKQLLAVQQQSAGQEAVLQQRLDEALELAKQADERVTRRNRQIERLNKAAD